MPTRILHPVAGTFRKSPSITPQYVETNWQLIQEVKAKRERILSQMDDDLHQALIEDEILGEVAGMEMGMV